MEKFTCSICKKEIDSYEAYEYRGVIACEKHIDELQTRRDFERSEIIEEEKAKTEVFRALDLSDSTIGKANKEILKSEIGIAKKESARIKNYESRQ